MLCALCRLYNRQCFQTRINFLFISILLLRNQLIILLPLLWVHMMKVMPLTKNNLYQMYFCMINELTTFLPTNSSLFAVSLQSNQILNLLLMVNGLLQWPCTVKSFFLPFDVLITFIAKYVFERVWNIGVGTKWFTKKWTLPKQSKLSF